MNSDGSMYMPPEMAKELEEAFKDRVEGLTTSIHEGSIPIEDEGVARELALMNRKARLAFYSARKHGQSEWASLDAAKATLAP